MRPRVHIGVRCSGFRDRARLRFDDLGVLKERCRLGRGSELAAELTKHQVLGFALNQAEHGSIPKRGSATEPQNNLIALRDGEELSHAILDRLHKILHRSLPVRGPEQVLVANNCLDLSVAHLGGASAETAINRNHVCRDAGKLAHSYS